MALSTVSGILTRLGSGQARAGSGSSSRSATSARGRASSCTSTSSGSGRIEGGAGKRVTGGIERNPDNRAGLDAAGVERNDDRLGVRPRLRRRLQPARLRRGAPRREGDHRDRLPPPRDSPSTAATASPVERVLTDNGTRLRLSTARARLPQARHPPPAAPAPTGHKPTARPSASSAPSLAGWAYGAIYRSSQERTTALDGWLWHYNHRTTTLSPRPPTPGHQNQPARVLHLGLERNARSNADLAPPDEVDTAPDQIYVSPVEWGGTGTTIDVVLANSEPPELQ